MFSFRQIALAAPIIFLTVGPYATTHLAAQTPSAKTPAPIVDSVEPPNWWAGHSINPVRILLHGRNLAGSRVTAIGSGVSASNPHASSNGDYLFFDLSIAKAANVGPRKLKIIAPGGSTTAEFDIDKSLPTTGRFQGFSPDDVIYLIMPDRFSDGDPTNDDPAISKGQYDRLDPHKYHGGDFQGIINHLPYLKDLGVTAIWITPIYDNDNKVNADYHGYGAVDFYRTEEHFGEMAKLRELVDKAHALGLKVIQDEVANHSGQNHPWNSDPPTPTWYNGTKANHLNDNWQTWTLTDPHGTPQESDTTVSGWFVNLLPDINQNDPEVAKYETQNTLWWMGMAGFDGIREDTFSYVPRSFWQKWNTAIKAQYPKVNVVGEVYDGDVGVVAFFQGGRTQADGIDTGVYSLFDFPVFYPLRRVFAQGNSVQDLARQEAHDWMFPNAGNLVTFLGLHDMQRFMNETGATPQGLELAQTFLLTNRGIPMIYYGDEIGMPGGNDPDNRRDFPGGFPGDTRNAFTSIGRTPQEEEIFQHVRTLTHLRAALAPLRRGSQKTLYLADQQWVYARILGNAFVITAINNDAKPATFTFVISPLAIADGTRLSDKLGNAGTVRVTSGSVTITLAARSAAILTR
jgi:glycosidase